MIKTETTLPLSTLDVNTGPKNPDPDVTFGNVSGDFYGLTCAVPYIEAALGEAIGLGRSVSITTQVSELQNIVIGYDDPGVSEYLRGNYGIEIPPETYGPDNLLRLKDLEEYDELKPMTSPRKSTDPVKDGVANSKAFIASFGSDVMIGHVDLLDLIDSSITHYKGLVEDDVNLSNQGKKNALWKLDRITKPLLVSIKANCYKRNTQMDHMFLDNVIIKADASDVLLYNDMKHYNANSMSRRRPPGDFFTVEMIAPPTDGSSEPVRVDLEAAEGRIVTSLKLNMSPASLVVNGAKKINRYPTLIRWVEEHWGDEMDQVSFSGTSFSFLDFKTGSGLCADSRNLTEPYKELRHLVDIYTQNGVVYQPQKIEDGVQRRTFFNMGDPANPYRVVTHPRAGMVKYRLYIKLTCYFAEFVGYFDSFDVSESSANPFSLNYNVSFRSEHTKWL